MVRCSKCVIPMGTKGTSFNSEGVCNLCADIKKTEVLGEDKLKETVHNYLRKDSKGKVNCIVPISGGRDSTFVLYVAIKLLGLNPLAVQFDNCFHTDQAKKNLEKATKILGVDLVKGGPNKNTMHTLVKEGIKLAYHFKDPSLMSDLICHGCGTFHKFFVYKIAKQKHIPLILWGDAVDESSSIMQWNRVRISNFKKIFSKSMVNRLRYRYYVRKLDNEFNANIDKMEGDLHIFNYLEWDRKHIVNTIKNELAWDKPKEAISTWRIDCKLSTLSSYLIKKAFGADKMEVGFSNFIRAGKMSRDDAIRQLNDMSAVNTSIIKKTCFDLNIEQKIVDWIINN